MPINASFDASLKLAAARSDVDGARWLDALSNRGYFTDARAGAAISGGLSGLIEEAFGVPKR